MHPLIQQYLTRTQDRQCPLGNKHFINLVYKSFLLLVYAIFSGMLQDERLLLNHANTPGFLAPGGEEFNPGPETRLDRSELLCNKVLLKYKGDRESF